ncbi:PASTA domain-containing protein [Vagococcus vulneris]|uniref:PASTA domain-containing protein n=1 Tax=Vagococcus vulneris TaxID=1977869 RepID=A0A430A222_9ENTE|nr:PASTA domain-containing protein [Vagococcus vulneris]RSU00491.1 hypothetical protein CBF37_00315 [Vagococcus vulneris]
MTSKNELNQMDIPKKRRRKKRKKRQHTDKYLSNTGTHGKNNGSNQPYFYVNDQGQLIKRVKRKRRRDVYAKQSASKPINYKRMIPVMIIVLLLSVAVFALFMSFGKKNVAAPDFTDKHIGAAEKWANEKRIPLTVKEVKDTTSSDNVILDQELGSNRDGLTVFVNSKDKKDANLVRVPDFNKKPLEDVKKWAEENKIQLIIQSVESTVDENKVITQSAKPEDFIAKDTVLTVTVSKKSDTVLMPDFEQWSLNDVKERKFPFNITVKEEYSESVPYGKLIKQSKNKGESIDKDNINENIAVVYSLGKPFLKAYFGQPEGDIAKFLFEDYESKGVKITYKTYPIDSAALKGTIIAMSSFNQYIPMTYQVSFGISTGYAPPQKQSICD